MITESTSLTDQATGAGGGLLRSLLDPQSEDTLSS